MADPTASLPPVVALIGPTGAGKSAVAVRAAATTGAAIVAIDAFTVYRQMSIGTAKPDIGDQRRVPHHMIDLLDVEQTCTVQWFQERARAVIQQVRAAGHPVLLVGGSGLYFRAVVDPLDFPPTDPLVRSRIEREVEADVVGGFDRLTSLDPDAASRMDAANTRRIVRALEVIEITGRTFTSYRTGWNSHRSIYGGLVVVGAQVDRDDLTTRIDRRTWDMLDAGWVGECRFLADRSLSTTAAQAIGYAEILSWLSADEPVPIDDVAERISIRTRQFANRQRRWFAGDPRVDWTAGPDLVARLCHSLTARR